MNVTHTPVSKVQTRRGKRLEQEMSKLGGQPSQEQPGTSATMPSTPLDVAGTGNIDVAPESCVKTEMRRPPSRVPSLAATEKSKRSTASTLARRKRLQLEADEQKAKIQMELIDKRLAADLADLEDDDYSSLKGSGVNHTRCDVDEWVKTTSEHHPEKQQAAPDPTGPAYPLPSATAPADTIDGTIQMLASAVQNLSARSIHAPNSNLLSRICTPRDLPEFSGEPLDWLSFRQAYEESTEVCSFTPKENLWRLRKCLKGSAKEAVSALLISATSPDRIMETLQLRFGDPDTIIARLIHDIKKLHPVSQEYQKDIVPFSVKVLNFVEAVRAVGREDYLQGTSMVSIILSKLPTVLISKWSDFSYPLIKAKLHPQLNILADFLHDEAVKISTTANINTLRSQSDTYNSYKPRNYDVHGKSQTVLFQSEKPSVNTYKCQFCRATDHIKLTECKKFKKALRKVRWQYIKRRGICFKCLNSTHSREACNAPVCDVDHCGLDHHKLLHYPNKMQDVPSQPEESQTQSESALNTQSETITHVNSSVQSVRKVLLKVVPIRIYKQSGGYIDTSALLDDGSTVSLISAELAIRAGITGLPETMRVCGPWNNEMICDVTVMKLELSGLDDKVYSIKARSVNKLNLPTQMFSIVNYDMYNHLNSVKENLCNYDVKPELLIGQDNYNLLHPLKILLGKCNSEPSATLTPLGWCIHGSVHMAGGSRRRGGDPAAILLLSESSSSKMTGKQSLEDRELQALHEEVRQSFSLESMGVSGKPRCNRDEVIALEHLERTAVKVNDRWHVGLPWKEAECAMPDTFPGTFKRLQGVERKMAKDAAYAKRYADRIDHLLLNDFAKELTDISPTTPRTYYLPHFGVDNPNKNKLRLVFDAAYKTKGKSLNDYLHTGPDLLTSLLGIMLRFREHKTAVTADIQDMFLRIKILPQDQDAFRFLWRNSSKDPVKTYVMTSLLFGARCSPFIAQFVKNKNAQQYTSSMPAEVDAICHSHYMDDYIQSLPDDATAIQMVRNITYIHKEGGFHIRNWTSNSLQVLDSVPKETLGAAAVRFKIDQQSNGERTLGLIWYPDTDELAFDVSLKRIPDNVINGKQKPTKRLMLRVIMSVFDVIGFLSPFTIQGKIMLQNTWRLNISWDDPVPADIYSKWCEWIDLLKVISDIRIPRCYQRNTRVSETEVAPLQPSSSFAATAVAATATSHFIGKKAGNIHTNLRTNTTPQQPMMPFANLELHIFSDASPKAMCAVAYWRWELNHNICTAFIASKCRVAPVKSVTIPRLELQAALLAARLAKTICHEHTLSVTKRVFWCDSTIVLHWLRNNTRTYKPFEANRLGEIDELTSVSEWRYIPTKLNVADIATRDVFNYDLFRSEWIKGPSFLYNSEAEWPQDFQGSVEPETDYVSLVQCNKITLDLPVPDSRVFSSWLRLLRSTAVVLYFIGKCRKLTSVDECTRMAHAESLLLQQAQADSFSHDLWALKNGKVLTRDSKLRTLTPYLDEQGLLRVGGRIDAASDVPVELKRPIILDGKHPTTRLLVEHFHRRAAHGNHEAVVNDLKQKYWIIKLRPTVRSVVSRCLICRLKKVKPVSPRMGDLPAARMAHHQRPFTYCGVDLFGPMEVSVCRRREKRYVVLFTCLTVRAVHLEIVHSLTTDALIMALRRMASRRGWPRYIYSDNGTNLKGANTELRKSLSDITDEALRAEAVNNGAQWSFIPPASPHWGGAWERLVRSVKSALHTVLKERSPKDEVLATLMAEVENIVNGRPLTHVSVEPGSTESLTPNHFLLGSSSNLPVAGAFNDSDLWLRKQWRVAQRLADMYWKRWINEYLPDLIPRRKWHSEQTPLRVGDLVFIADPNATRNVWPRGLVVKLFPGKDGRVRVVEVKTATGVLRRSAARVAPLAIGDEC